MLLIDRNMATVEGIYTYALFAHGLLFPGEVHFKLPPNVIVIMNCFSQLQYCETHEQCHFDRIYSKDIFDTVTKKAFLANSINGYVEQIREITEINRNNHYCVFHDSVPNLKLSGEMNKWRDGIHLLPKELKSLQHIINTDRVIRNEGIDDLNEYSQSFEEYLIPAEDETYQQKIHEFFSIFPDLFSIINHIYQNPLNQNYLNVIIVHACTVQQNQHMIKCYDYSYQPIMLKGQMDDVITLIKSKCGFTTGGNKNAKSYVTILGRKRKIKILNNKKCIRYQKQWITVAEAKKMEKEIELK
jgi:hypothetical protein